MRRNLWFWMYFIAAILLAIYFSVRIIMAFVGHGPISMVRGLSVSADTPNKDLTSVISAIGISPGTRTYSINLGLVNTRIAQTPGVKQSAVRRLPNGNLSIQLRLYRAVAAWTDGSFYYPISADGTIVKNPSETRGPDTVVFRGTVPNDISNITKSATNLIEDLDYLEWVDNRRWNLVTNGGITVMLPEKDPVAAMGNLVMLNNKHKILSKKIKTLDMRDNARILVK